MNSRPTGALRILVAPQELKGTLTAAQAADALCEGLRAAAPGDALHALPLADGGPGTLEALLRGAGGTRREARVLDPLGREVEAAFALLPDGTAVVELAQSSGLWRLQSAERDPLRASTFGTGQLIRAALDAGARRLLVGAGGSATHDGGAGALQALGARLLDDRGGVIAAGAGGGALADVGAVELSGLDARLARIPVEVATDVTSPLLGAQGAALFAPQKGASPAQVEALERALSRFAAVLEVAAGRSARMAPGAGAAGGLAFGLACALGARLRGGFDVVAESSGLDDLLARVDQVLTAEGRLDAQTGLGKGPWALALRARAHGVPVTCFAGSVDPDADRTAFAAVIEVSPSRVPSPAGARALLMEAARRWRTGLSPGGDEGAPAA